MPAPAPASPPAAVAPLPPKAVLPAGATGADRHRNALEMFRAGDLNAAAATWESILSGEHRTAFTLLLMTACQRETIQGTQRALPSPEMYLVSKKVNGRECFRVCLGTYSSREAANRALATLPAEYRSAGAAVRPVDAILDRDR